jgi:hypothetical protein
MRRKGSVKEGYDGRSLTRRGHYFGRRKNYWKEGRDCRLEVIIFLV